MLIFKIKSKKFIVFILGSKNSKVLVYIIFNESKTIENESSDVNNLKIERIIFKLFLLNHELLF